MNNLWQDIRYALRQLSRAPGFTLTAVLTLALGIAANSTIFSWIDSTLFNPIPGVTHTGDMITIQRGEPSEHPSPPFSYDDYIDLRAGATGLQGLIGYHDDYVNLTGSGEPERIYAAQTSANYFEVLGVKPLLGRTLADTAANEREGAAEAVLGYNLWQQRFAGDPAIVGKSIQINLHVFTIVGVAPRQFQGCKAGLRTELWIPLGAVRQIWDWHAMDDRSVSWLNVLGVVRSGVSRPQVQNELNFLMNRIVVRYPESHRGDNQLTVDPLWRSPFGANVYLAGTLPLLLALAAVLLLLACANVANLLLVRSVSRRREFAIRLSLGATRWILVRQLMIENLFVAFAAGLLALTVTFWTAHSLAAFLPSSSMLPLSINGSVNSVVTSVTLLVALLTAGISGAIPALRAASLSPVTVLKDEALNLSGGLHKSRLSSSLVIAQVALSLVLLTCAGLLVRSLEKAQAVNPGFDPHNVYLATYDLSPMKYSTAKALEFDRQVLARVRALPGVRSATLADFSPLNFTIHSDGLMPEGYVSRAHESVEADRGIVAPHYLETMGTPLLAGREFNDADNADSQPVAMVNQAFADRYWPGQNAIGKHIQLGQTNYTVVGLAGNAKYRRLINDPAPTVFLPLMQWYQNQLLLQVRVAGDPSAFASSIDRAVLSLNPNLPLFGVTTLEESMQMGSIFERISVVFAGCFGLLAMVLAAVGIYAVVAQTTRQRTHEIGIRMALGAARGDVFRQILRRAFGLTLAGMAIGVMVSLVVTRFLRGMLYGVGTADWLTFTTVSAALCLVTLAACYFPAARAASIDPMLALRNE